MKWIDKLVEWLAEVAIGMQPKPVRIKAREYKPFGQDKRRRP